VDLAVDAVPPGEVPDRAAVSPGLKTQLLKSDAADFGVAEVLAAVPE